MDISIGLQSDKSIIYIYNKPLAMEMIHIGHIHNLQVGMEYSSIFIGDAEVWILESRTSGSTMMLILYRQ